MAANIRRTKPCKDCKKPYEGTPSSKYCLDCKCKRL